MVLLAAPGWEGAPLPKMPGWRDCHPLPHLERASKWEPRVHGPSRPHRAGVGHQGSSCGPGFEVQVEASVWVQEDACESVQGPSHCCCSQDVRLSPEAVIWSEGRDSQGETQVSTHKATVWTPESSQAHPYPVPDPVQSALHLSDILVDQMRRLGTETLSHLPRATAGKGRAPGHEPSCLAHCPSRCYSAVSLGLSRAQPQPSGL